MKHNKEGSGSTVLFPQLWMYTCVLLGTFITCNHRPPSFLRCKRSRCIFLSLEHAKYLHIIVFSPIYIHSLHTFDTFYLCFN